MNPSNQGDKKNYRQESQIYQDTSINLIYIKFREIVLELMNE